MNRALLIAKVLPRGLSTAATPYPFARNAIILPSPSEPPPTKLQDGRSLMDYVSKTLPTPLAQKMISTLFSRRHPDRLLPGSVLTVTLQHAPTTFSGVLIAIRRRGPDTSFTLRNIINRTGVEMQFFVGSPALKDIQVIQKAGGGGGKVGRRARRAKLFYLRDDASKMSAISAGVQRR